VICRNRGIPKSGSKLPRFRRSRPTRHPSWCVADENRRDQMDAAVIALVRRQRRPSPASCTGLQSRQLPAHASNAGADQGLVADESERETDQDRREGGEPRSLCSVSDGRGRHSPKPVRRDPADDRGTATAHHIGSVRRSFFHAFAANHRRSAVRQLHNSGEVRLDDRKFGIFRRSARSWPASRRSTNGGGSLGLSKTPNRARLGMETAAIRGMSAYWLLKI
jgi:hypothetical protein